MNAPDRELEQLRAAWVAPAGAERAATRAERQLASAKRSAQLGQAVLGAIALSGVALVGLALVHAANALEAALGIVVGAGICGAWLGWRALDRREQRAPDATTVEHLSRAAGVRRGRKRLAEFVIVVLALDLVFLVPWWVIGTRVHARRITSAGAIGTMWLPLLVMALVLLWAVRTRRHAARELARLTDAVRGDA